MKILAETKKEHYLVEVSDKELANILGKSYITQISSTVRDAISTSKDFSISSIYQNYERSMNLLRADKYSYASIEGLQNGLKTAIETLDNLKPVIEDFKKILKEEEDETH